MLKIVFKTNFYMRTFTILFSLLAMSAGAKAQAVATFEGLTLAHADTFYVNYTASGTDVGFNDGMAHFPCIYDTSYGGIWTYGFAYSNMTDTVTSGFGNQYSAKAGHGYDTSHQYAVAHCSNPVTYAPDMIINLTGPAMGHPVPGFYVTNTTYAYNSIRDGDMFARKFHNGDWFKLIVRGFHSGAMLPDSVTVYLADFLFPDTTMNYILKTWEWVNTGTLGNVDSLQLSLRSSDNGLYGMNTPAYFCIDNFTTYESVALQAGNVQVQPTIKVYPDPATEVLYVEIPDSRTDHATVLDMTGRVVGEYRVDGSRLSINTSALSSGSYILHLGGNGITADVRFVKQ